MDEHPAGGRTPEDMAAALLAVARDRQTYRNLGYLLLAFPLGLLDAALLLTAFAGVPALLGAGIFVALDRGGAFGPFLAAVLVLVGVAALPGLLPAFAAARAQVGLEGRLARALLRGPVAPAAPAAHPSGPHWLRLRARLTDLESARALAFLVVRLPLGALSLLALAGAGALTLGLLAAPVAYRQGLDGAFGAAGVDTLAEATVCALLAPVAALLGLHLTNAVAWASAELARLLLNPHPQARYAWAVAGRQPHR
jgi:Putative sensor